MEAIPIKDAISNALKKGNWMAYAPLSTVQDNEFYFFQSKTDAREFCYDNGSDQDRWTVTYIKHPESFLNAAKISVQAINYQFIKSYKMNEQNINYLKENIKYMGFGEKLHTALEQQLAAGKSEFQLLFQATVNQKPFEATLNFRKADNSDMYFFNGYIAKLERRDNQSVEQTFYINKGKGVTAKEAFNLLEGRSVFKELTNKEEHPYAAWLQLDFKNKDKHGNYIVKQYHENYGYDLAKALTGLPVKELQGDTQRIELVKSLEKGNIQAVTAEIGGKQQRIFMEANPQYKTVNLYDGQMNRLKKDNMIQDHSKTIFYINTKVQQEKGEKLNAKEVHTDKVVKVKRQKDKTAKQEKDNSLLPKKRVSRKKSLTQ